MIHHMTRRSSILLLELILSVFLLTACSAVVMRFFASARTVQQDADMLQKGTALMSGVAEGFLTDGRMDEAYPWKAEGDHTYLLYLDGDGNPSAFEDGFRYVVSASFSREEDERICRMVLERSDGVQLHGLTVSRYDAQERRMEE